MTEATARIARTDLPHPTAADPERGGGQLEAIQALYDAYMALNAAGGNMARCPGPMDHIATAVKQALATLPGVTHRQARTIWYAMCENAAGAHWNYDLWRNSEI